MRNLFGSSPDTEPLPQPQTIFTESDVLPNHTFADLHLTMGSPLRPEESTCLICLDDLKETKTLTHEYCGYSYHVLYLEPWLVGQTNLRCPYCNVQLTYRPDIPLLPREKRRERHVADLTATDSPWPLVDALLLDVHVRRRVEYEETNNLPRAKMLRQLGQASRESQADPSKAGFSVEERAEFYLQHIEIVSDMTRSEEDFGEILDTVRGSKSGQLTFKAIISERAYAIAGGEID